MLHKALIVRIAIATTLTVLVGFTLIGLGERKSTKASEPIAVILATPVRNPLVPTQTSLIAYPIPTSTPTPTLLPTPTVFPTITALPTPIANIYVVQPGDTFFGIAQKLGVDWQILALINGTNNPDQTIYPGEVINIPDPSWVPAATIDGKQIIVVIGQQKVYAFDKGVLVNTFVVSTGTVYRPTVLGNFQIAKKLPSRTITDGVDYTFENVPYIMYLENNKVPWTLGYALHGTYWHNNFGHPMSHGCVNMTESDAKWLYEWTPVGTVVTIIN
ncbi:MAG: hypothetical protein UU12_C0044G0002 [Candidatus Woesebacteria bacterium GW2011_GWA2_40_7b]|uniref:Uncharacterized protein n=1 Tax=Candidatus Woesebacteria bacterium GW2011_GWA2_40_7b TaxID=1618563 RepID=A0A0G0SXJ9_9BACT|nr:MAG: hypothetical protein UU12_C0044G0002 [Candidatus Woesebacteria bacterium GW2011_GWA2_40_7b]